MDLSNDNLENLEVIGGDTPWACGVACGFACFLNPVGGIFGHIVVSF